MECSTWPQHGRFTIRGDMIKTRVVWLYLNSLMQSKGDLPWMAQVSKDLSQLKQREGMLRVLD